MDRVKQLYLYIEICTQLKHFFTDDSDVQAQLSLYSSLVAGTTASVDQTIEATCKVEPHGL